MPHALQTQAMFMMVADMLRNQLITNKQSKPCFTFLLQDVSGGKFYSKSLLGHSAETVGAQCAGRTTANFCTTGNMCVAAFSRGNSRASGPQLSTASSRTESWSAPPGIAPELEYGPLMHPCLLTNQHSYFASLKCQTLTLGITTEGLCCELDACAHCTDHPAAGTGDLL